ncbi:MAG TPA: HDOD domain-containing protein [Exilispira sp.]|nr:HDOD domain-containing protein [Exilispira sp.]
MVIKCPKCGKSFILNDSLIKSNITQIFCPNCNNRIIVEKKEEETKSNESLIQIPKEKLDKILSKIEDLPTLPIVIQRILQLINDPKATTKQIGSIITSDQSLTAKTLKLVNSAFYGFSKKITTVDQAIVIIGFNAVKNLAISASVFDIFKNMNQKSSFDRYGFWTHSTAVAFIAKQISEDTRIGNPGEVFVSALMHDIGKIILDVYFSDEMNRILYNANNKNISFIQSEEEILGFTHPEVGFLLSRKWNLPDNLYIPIRYHHNPNKAIKYESIVAIVHTANIIAKAGNIGYDGDSVTPKISTNAWNLLKQMKPDLSAETIKIYIDSAKHNIEASDFLKVAIS